MTARWVGPAIVGAAVLALAGLLAAVLLGRGDVVRPDLTRVPLPEGSITRFATERCDTFGDQRVCEVVLAVGPVAGIDLPRPTDAMLAEHLVAAGWQVRDRATGDTTITTLTAPDGGTVARIGPLASLRDDAPGLVDDIEAELEGDFPTSSIAVVILSVTRT